MDERDDTTRSIRRPKRAPQTRSNGRDDGTSKFSRQHPVDPVAFKVHGPGSIDRWGAALNLSSRGAFLSYAFMDPLGTTSSHPEARWERAAANRIRSAPGKRQQPPWIDRSIESPAGTVGRGRVGSGVSSGTRSHVRVCVPAGLLALGIAKAVGDAGDDVKRRLVGTQHAHTARFRSKADNQRAPRINKQVSSSRACLSRHAALRLPCAPDRAGASAPAGGTSRCGLQVCVSVYTGCACMPLVDRRTH